MHSFVRCAVADTTVGDQPIRPATTSSCSCPGLGGAEAEVAFGFGEHVSSAPPWPAVRFQARLRLLVTSRERWNQLLRYAGVSDRSTQSW